MRRGNAEMWRDSVKNGLGELVPSTIQMIDRMHLTAICWSSTLRHVTCRFWSWEARRGPMTKTFWEKKADLPIRRNRLQVPTTARQSNRCGLWLVDSRSSSGPLALSHWSICFWRSRSSAARKRISAQNGAFVIMA